MGVVFEAQQRVALKRRVALKVMKPGLDSKDVLARFEAERQALAVMQHHGIAKVLDAGATEEGRPYFVMELVDGESLKDYADGKKLSIEDRVRLFIEVCRAVQHAHLKGVIHRDLKPSNVLVTERDDVPSPKVIDFGVAKALGQRPTETTLVTGFGQALGTPAYMSPEQADASGLDVDTRTDVYSLGVTLYELLVGRLPQDPDELGFAGFMTKLLMRDMDPPTPSTRYDTLEGDTQQAIAKFRRTDPKGLHHKVRGDLDWIAMKAIEKDRERRYATANDLALDLERYLRDEPVVARPPSARYRAAKFVRRHRAGVLTTAAVAAVVIGSAVAVSVQAARIARARDRTEAAEAFLQEWIWAADPFEGEGPDVTVVEALDAASEKITDRLQGQPEVEAAVKNTFGVAYFKLGRHEKARPLLESALEIRQRVHAGQHPDVAESMDYLADLERDEGHFAMADSLYRAALAMRRSTLGNFHPDVTVSLIGLGILRREMRDFEAAESALSEALAIRERVAADTGDLAEAWDALGTLYWAQERYVDAEPWLQEALDARRSYYAEESGVVASSMNNLAALLDDMADYEHAESLYREARALLQRRASQSATQRYQLGQITGNLAVLLDLGKGEYDAAESMYREALAIKKAVLGDDHPEVALARHNLAGLLCVVRGELAEGVTLLDDAIPVFERVQDYRSAIARSMRGLCLTGLGRYREAETDLLAALPALETEYSVEHSRTQQARERLVALYEAWGRPDQATLYRENPTPPE
jgi:tetratricopeptide (TPR) repeat protein/tRNA A-37 threonylcarbamoyl transferase component Bud32